MSLFSSLIRFSKRALSGRCSFIAAPTVAALVSSCANIAYPLDPAALQARGLKPGEGYIAGTFTGEVRTRSGEKPKMGASGSVTVTGKGASSGSMAVISPQVMPVNRNPYLIGGGRPSEVFAIAVPAGDYEITSWSMTGSGSTGPVTIMTRKPLKAAFQVKAGEAAYVGRFHSMALMGRNLLGFPVFADGLILASDQFKEDQERIPKFYPVIKKGSIRQSGAAAAYMAEMKRIAEEPRFLGLF